MYKLIRFFNQNRKNIIKTILVIVFIISIIQLLNYLSKNSNNSSDGRGSINYNNNYKELSSDKSLVSGEKLSDQQLKKDIEIIKEFIEKCNEQNIDSAYEIISKECKEVMFPTLEDFYNIYYLRVFEGNKKIYTIENWTSSTYQIKFTDDILSSGKLNINETRQDYITVTKENGENKLNINSYIERKVLNKVTVDKNVEVTITSIDKYMDYEIYNLSIKNNSNNTILLSTNDDPESIYLLDSNNMKYYFYNNEIVEHKLKIQGKFTNNIQIKFNNSYRANKKITNIIFSKLITDYKEYVQLENKEEYNNFYVLRVNV